MTDEFNFDQSVEQAWRRFALRLSSVLSVMDETEPLTLHPYAPGDGQWYLQFHQESQGYIDARVPTHIHDSPVSEAQAMKLVDLGWERSEEGFHYVDSQDHSGELAQVAVSVLREVFQVEHPVFLDSNVLTEILCEPPMAEESVDGLLECEQSAAYAYLNQIQLVAAVADELSTIFGSMPMRDQDGDFAVRVGSTMVFVRIPADGKEIRLFAVLVHDIAGRSRAAEVLNDVNAHARWVRFSLVRDRIIAAMSLYASPFVPAHFRQAITEMTNVADGVDDLLAVSLQGKTTFPEEAPL